MNQPQIRILNTQTVCEWSKYRTLSVVKRRVDGTRQYGRCGRGDEKESAVTASEKSLHTVVVSTYFGHKHGLQHQACLITDILLADPLHGPLISLEVFTWTQLAPVGPLFHCLSFWNWIILSFFFLIFPFWM